jgi:hypothetical protein
MMWASPTRHPGARMITDGCRLSDNNNNYNDDNYDNNSYFYKKKIIKYCKVREFI